MAVARAPVASSGTLALEAAAADPSLHLGMRTADMEPVLGQRVKRLQLTFGNPARAGLSQPGVSYEKSQSLSLSSLVCGAARLGSPACSQALISLR